MSGKKHYQLPQKAPEASMGSEVSDLFPYFLNTVYFIILSSFYVGTERERERESTKKESTPPLNTMFHGISIVYAAMLGGVL